MPHYIDFNVISTIFSADNLDSADIIGISESYDSRELKELKEILIFCEIYKFGRKTVILRGEI